MRKGYFGDTGSQIHYREVAPQNDAGLPPLLCLPPAPHSGLFYETVMPHLNKKRRVVAIDYPGYGSSDPIDTPSIPDYAESLAAMAERFGPVDTLGFHTGTLVAAELARLCPNKVNKIAMVDVPFFNAGTRKTYGEKFSGQDLPTALGAGFEEAVTERHHSSSGDRAYALWAETLRSGRHRNAAFQAAFAFDCQSAFSKLDANVTLIATQSNLLELTRAAAIAIQNASSVECLNIDAPVFEAHAAEISSAILAALSS